MFGRSKVCIGCLHCVRSDFSHRQSMPTILVTERQMGSRLDGTPQHAVSRPISRRLSVGSGNLNMFNPFKPSVRFFLLFFFFFFFFFFLGGGGGLMQTMQTKIRRRRTRRLIKVSTVCLQKVPLKFDKNA